MNIETNLEKRILDLIFLQVNNLNYEIVRIKIFGKTETLQIMIDNSSNNITVADCKKVSKLVSSILDRTDIKEKYDLEISSPGIDRPLIKLDDFVKYKNHIIDLKLKSTEYKNKRMIGKIIDVKNNMIDFINNKNLQLLCVEFDLIESAQLVITEELLKTTK